MLLHIITSINKKGENVVLAKNRLNKISYFFPYKSRKEVDRRQLYNLNKGFHHHLYEKYVFEDAKLKNTDTVIDCGAFVGGFTVAANNFGVKHIYSFEPSTDNFECLQLNMDKFNVINVTTIKKALGNNIGSASLNLSNTACDNSILEPDEGSIGESEEVSVTTLSNVIEQYNIDEGELFLKVEAEGYEPEILKGLGSYRPRVISVDVTPERNGESPRELIQSILSEAGYTEFHHSKRCLVAIKNN